METDQLVDQTETINGTPIKIIKRQTDIVPIVFEQFDQRVDLINVSLTTAMNTSPFDKSYCGPPDDVRSLIPYSQTYARSNNLRSDNFIIFLDYLERINSIQEFSPDSNQLYVYRDKTHRNLFGFDLFRKSPYAEMQHCMGGDWLNWNTLSQRPKSRNKKKALQRINESEAPLVLNISLDGFWFNTARMKEEFRKARTDHLMKVMTNGVRHLQAYWRGQEKYRHYSMDDIPEINLGEYDLTSEEVTQEQLNKRAENFSTLISGLKKLDLIILSESQKPIPTCPPQKVEHLETLVLKTFEVDRILFPGKYQSSNY